MRVGAGLPERVLSFFAPFALPKIFQDTHILREYIRSDEFSSLRAVHGDLYAVDRIFLKSLEITWSNYYEALLISSFSVMDHRNFGVNLPVVGSLFWFPLTSEFPDEFEDRIRRLPMHIYPDSPENGHGDRDKLQHFFGSAFVQFVSESKEGAERLGDMVELGESAFIVGGQFDERDRRANQHGRSFGLSLLRGSGMLPSDFLLLVVAASGSISPEDVVPAGVWCGTDNAVRVWEER